MRCDTCGKEMKKILTSKPYHYKESGLDNVYIKGIPVYKCVCGETAAEVPKVEELHTVIAGFLLRKTSPLVGKEIKFLRKQRRLKAIELAEQLGINKVTLSRWENNAESIGPASDKLLRLTFLLHYIRNLFEYVDITPETMFRYFVLADKITTMHKPSQRRKKIQISKEDLQRASKSELLLATV